MQIHNACTIKNPTVVSILLYETFLGMGKPNQNIESIGNVCVRAFYK